MWSMHGSKESSLCPPRPEYLALGVAPLERQKKFHALFAQHVEDTELLKEMRGKQTRAWRLKMTDLKRA